jgi:methylmalonyl-CoA mutase
MTSETAVPTTDFAAEFPATEAEWRKAAEAALKGRPLGPILRRQLIDGVPVEAIVRRAPAKPIAGRAPATPWIAMTRIDLGDPDAARAQALEDLENGASGLSLVLAPQDDRTGVAADTLERLDRSLDGVMLDLAPIHLDAPAFGARTAAALLAALVERRGHRPADVSILFGLDLLRDLARTGSLALTWDRLGEQVADDLKFLIGRGFKAPILMVDQRPAHEAGASEAVEHIRLMSGNGVEPAAVAGATAFAFACDADQFAVIAKLRAARLLWAAVRREFGLDERPVHIHCETSRRMLTRKDCQTNMVRSTIAAFAAGVGGADSVTVLPHTFALGGADKDARRIARNAQSIVLEESNAYRVADPAAGAGAIEALTDALAGRAWDLFREIEGVGGMFRAMSDGVWQERISKTRDTREDMVARRKIPIVGVSEFPKADEAEVVVPKGERSQPASSSREPAKDLEEMVAAFASGASVADFRGHPSERRAATLKPSRLAEPFERLRADNEAREPRPAAFLALLGPIARHSARAGFVRNLMDAGGVLALDGPVGAEPAEAARAWKDSGAKIAVVCGADGDYAEDGAPLVKALATAGATVWLAGRPKDGAGVLEQAGVTRFVAAGDDALEILAAASGLGGKTGGAL